MLVSQLQHTVQILDVFVRHKSEAPRLVSALVLQNHAVLHQPEAGEVRPELLDFQVLGQTTHKHFSELRVNGVVVLPISRRIF